MDSETLTDEMIQTLLDEAGEYGDGEMHDICCAALEGTASAREECARVINSQRSAGADRAEFVRVVA